jgi:hypothetical protein
VATEHGRASRGGVGWPDGWSETVRLRSAGDAGAGADGGAVTVATVVAARATGDRAWSDPLIGGRAGPIRAHWLWRPGLSNSDTGSAGSRAAHRYGSTTWPELCVRPGTKLGQSRLPKVAFAHHLAVPESR